LEMKSHEPGLHRCWHTECVVRFRPLDERWWRGIEIDTPNVRLARQDGSILSQCLLLPIRLEQLCSAIQRDVICRISL
jgi:hypothetical protein